VFPPVKLQQEASQTRRLFFVLSGEHSSLPSAEVRAILESAHIDYSRTEESYRLLTLEAPAEGLLRVSERSLMYDRCGIELGRCRADGQEIHKLVKNLPLSEIAQNARSFAVRSVRLGGVNTSIRRTDLERDVGSYVKDMLPQLSVRLHGPDVTFVCALFDESLLFGVEGYSKASGLIAPRRPRKRPVFHPSTMPPKIARCMVNLSRVHPGGLFLDPFCGVGGVLIEGAVVGCHVLGIDPDSRMLRGAGKNLRHFNLDPAGLLSADARHLPLREIDAVATDPPYGRGSSTRGEKVANLVRDFLVGVGDSLKNGAHVCISTPAEVAVEDYARHGGLIVVERHLVRVHRSLTRQFVVLRNP
jgi:tRNA (guanine10-N2)-dimethyltransferase